MACTQYGLKPEQARVGHIEAQIVRAQPLQPKLRELTHVTHQSCHSTTVSSQIHHIMGRNVYCSYCHRFSVVYVLLPCEKYYIPERKSLRIF